MSGKIRFEHNREHDVVIATVDWTIRTEKDARAWYKEYENYFAKLGGRKIDMIFELSKFTVHPRVAPLFGELRAKLLKHTNRSYRVKFEDGRTRTLMYTSAVLHGIAADNYATIEDAIEQLERDRAARR